MMNKIEKYFLKFQLFKRVLFFFAVAVSFSFLSCNQSVEPAGNFNEKYILFCLISPDSEVQKAYISRSYTTGNYNPYENTTDPALSGAQVKLIVNGTTEYNLIEATTQRSDTSRYKTPLRYYYFDKYRPANLDKVQIIAVLNNGVVLKSETTIPPLSSLYYTGTNYYHVLEFDPRDRAYFTAEWNLDDYKYTVNKYYYLAQLEIVYSKTSEGNIKHKIKLPTYFLYQQEHYIPYYQEITHNSTLIINSGSFDRIMTIISGDDPNKSDYVFYDMEFTLLGMDDNVANYLSSESTF